MRAFIDGKEVEFEAGETILSVANRAGAEIPTLCHDPSLPLEGGCRMCLVQCGKDGEIVAACHTELREGMEVGTTSPRIEHLRSDILSLILSEHQEDRFQPDPRGNEIERVIAGVEVPSSIFGNAPRQRESRLDTSHPYLRFDGDRCIVCRRCLHACETLQGQFVFGVEGRGHDISLIFGPGDTFSLSDCTACGACVDHCPTGAITDRDRMNAQPPDATVRSTCGFCGVGCQIEVDVENGCVQSISGSPDAQVNHGHLCSKGRYAHAYHRSADRLTQPLLRVGDDFREISWEEAYRWAADRLHTVAKENGPDALGGLASSRSTNEAAYLLQKLMRTVIGTNNVDCCARVCHSSTALALKTVTGTGAASASYTDIERARCIVVAGANPTEAHPVLGARIKEAAMKGVGLIVVDPRRIELAEFAQVHLALRPGTNVPLFNAIAKSLVERNQYDDEYVKDRTEGFEAFRDFVSAQSLSEMCELTEVGEEELRLASEIIANSGPILFVHGLGLSELTQGTDSIMALCNLGMLTGSIGRPGAGMLPLRGQNNVQGTADMGATPRFVTGYQDVGNEDVQRHLADLWGAAAPSEIGLTTTEMLDAAADGRLKGLWVQGEDLVQSDPYQSRTVQALENLELFIVQDPFFNESARYAHLVLPVLTTLENDGTYTNGERRVQRVRPAISGPGEARSDWEITRDVAVAMGADWSYKTPGSVMDEVAKAAPKLFGGMAYGRLEENGLQWPCPAGDHAGTECVHEDGFLRGKGLLTCLPYLPSPEQTSDGFPLLLITGRILQQYNVGTMTQRTPHRKLAPADELEIHPDDAAHYGIEDESLVYVESRWGNTRVPARISTRVNRGTLFLSFHYPESNTNRLVGPHVDPKSKCPEYKITAVRVLADAGQT